MSDITTASFGSWKSPITAEEIAGSGIRFGQIIVDGSEIYWNELRPNEQGRTTIVRWRPGEKIEEVLPNRYSARTKVHEYGGSSFAVMDGQIWFCNEEDQRVYAITDNGLIKVISPKGPYRYADLLVDRSRRRLICVREDHSRKGEPKNSLIAIGFDGSVNILVSGADFYAAPRLSNNGGDFAWIEWDHPNMPWDESSLMLCNVNDDGRLGDPIKITGNEESVFQPEFDFEGNLYFVSDRTGWWNLYRLTQRGIESVYPIEAEFGLPHWVFGMRMYDFATNDKVVAAFILDGISKLAEIDLRDGSARTIPVSHVDIAGLRIHDGRVCYIGGSMRSLSSIVSIELQSGQVEILGSSQKADYDAGVISIAQPVVFRTTNDEIAHGFYYPPRNDAFAAMDGELPPLIVKSHGGPTGQAGCAFEAKTQFWTSRGFAVLDVNYRGSSGFGRYYRRLLDSNWGVVDMEDCIAGARMLIDKGLVDSERIAITGSSAGGYTALCALTFSDVFKAGSSYYGISDLEALARDTHKFESRYLHRLVGIWPADREIYIARSPINHTDGLSCPVIFFQGLNDKVVPPNQATDMVTALRRKSIPVAYISFDGEAHGFRQAESIQCALEGELSFYGQIFGFKPADNIDFVRIENL